MKTRAARLTLVALLAAACGQGRPARPTAASNMEFSVSVDIPGVAASQRGHGLPSPIAVKLQVRDAAGQGAPLVGGTLSVYDAGATLLAQSPVAPNDGGQAALELAWPQAALGRRLDIRLEVRDPDGVLHVVESTLTL